VVSQGEALVELQFLGYMIPVILGIELGVYFFYQFWKNRDTKLRLNRILLSYGSFTMLMVIGALFQVTNRLFFGSANDILAKIGFFAIFLAPIGFMIFIIIKESARLINLKLARAITLASVTPIILLFLLGMQNLLFRLSIIITGLNAFFVIAYQLKLIRVSMGAIHHRVIQIFVGELLALSSLIFAANVVFSFIPIPPETFFFIGIGLLSSGFLIMFWAANDFPPFYEFDWRANLQKLFIIDQKNSQFLYARDFSKKIDSATSSEAKERDKLRDDLFSGAIAGIENMLSTITDSSKQKLSEINQGDAFILLEYGGKAPNLITFALVVKKDLSSLRHFLQTVKNQFESFFAGILKNLDTLELTGNTSRLFETFDIVVNSMMTEGVR